MAGGNVAVGGLDVLGRVGQARTGWPHGGDDCAESGVGSGQCMPGHLKTQEVGGVVWG